MNKNNHNRSKTINYLLYGISLILIVGILLFIFSYIRIIRSKKDIKASPEDARNYHIVITGCYENQLFLSQVYKGAEALSDKYKAVVELYVPSSQAEDVSLQKLLDYAAFVNADGAIVYIDSPDTLITPPRNDEGISIPLVTTGQYTSSIPQISFIGISYSELGRKIASETIKVLGTEGNVHFVGNDFSIFINYSSLTNSIQNILKIYPDINISFDSEISLEEESTDLIVCLTEKDTIKVAQLVSESEYKPKVIGFGGNETCNLYLEKGIIHELFAVNPEKIGEEAITELFEYRTKGYANSYISADVQITRGTK